MGKDPSLEHPWQKTPTQLIQYAEELGNKESDFEHQLAFLLIDVGVETMFMTYLSLPDEVIGADNKYHDRMDFVEKRSFIELVKGVTKTAGKSSKDLDLYNVLYFHNIRNKLYHLGDGIVPTEENLKDYLSLSKILLKELMGVDLSLSLSFEEVFERGTRRVNVRSGARRTSEEVGKCLGQLRLLSGIAFEKIRPELATRSFEKKLREIWEKYPDDESFLHWERTENQNNRLMFFNKLVGLEDEDYWFVDNCLQDVSYMHLAATSQELERDTDEDLNNYHDACLFHKNLQFRTLKDYEEYEITREKADEITTWIKGFLGDIEREFWKE